MLGPGVGIMNGLSGQIGEGLEAEGGGRPWGGLLL